MPYHPKYDPEAKKKKRENRAKLSDLELYIDYAVTREQYMRDRERT